MQMEIRQVIIDQTYNGQMDKRHYWEIDSNKNSSNKHGETIKNNDPNGIIHLEILE